MVARGHIEALGQHCSLLIGWLVSTNFQNNEVNPIVTKPDVLRHRICKVKLDFGVSHGGEREILQRLTLYRFSYPVWPEGAQRCACQQFGALFCAIGRGIEMNDWIIGK